MVGPGNRPLIIAGGGGGGGATFGEPAKAASPARTAASVLTMAFLMAASAVTAVALVRVFPPAAVAEAFSATAAPVPTPPVAAVRFRISRAATALVVGTAATTAAAVAAPFDAGIGQILVADFQSGNGEVVITEGVPEPRAGVARFARRRCRSRGPHGRVVPTTERSPVVGPLVRSSTDPIFVVKKRPLLQ